MMPPIDGSTIVLVAGAYLAYRIACWIGEPTTTPETGDDR